MAKKANYSPEAWARQLAHKRVYRYGLGAEFYDTLLRMQEGKCAICAANLVSARPRQKHIDHCHVSGLVRGIVCAKCNTTLGRFNDNPVLFAKAAEYLTNPPAKPLWS